MSNQKFNDFCCLVLLVFLIEMNCEITMWFIKWCLMNGFFWEDFCRNNTSLNHLENLLVRSNLSVYKFIVLFLSNFINTWTHPNIIPLDLAFILWGSSMS
jgi:hypothetical protein